MENYTIALQLCSNPSDPTSCCGCHFPNKTASGLCARCTKIQAADSEQEGADILNPNPVNGRLPLNNVNNPSGAAADIREFMTNHTVKKIQPAAKETVNNSATVLE
ncbi:hypothetical protein B0H14DRAFT_2648923 [Mycena olivaceomarginata]|nr:hypothetical protein B0H14DRAFT_2648923 [Mycena olivaceomarginata]